MDILIVLGIRMFGAIAVPMVDAWEWWKLPASVREKIHALEAIGAEVELVCRRPGAIVHLVRLDEREMLLVGAFLYGTARQGRYPMGANLEIHRASIRVVDGQPFYWARDERGWYPTDGYASQDFRFERVVVRGPDANGDAVVWARDHFGWHRCKGTAVVDGPFPRAPYGQRVEGDNVIPLFAEPDPAPSAGDAAAN